MMKDPDQSIPEKTGDPPHMDFRGAIACMIVVNAQVTLAPEHRRAFIREAHKIIPLVRSETGCTRYELVADLSSPLLVHFLEEWENQEHLDHHLVRPHMQEFFAKTTPWQAAPTELKIYEVLSMRSITMDS
jgi:quinol monooxygenase YgiN